MAINFNLNKVISAEGRYGIDQGLRSMHAGVDRLNTIDSEDFSLQIQRADKIREIVQRVNLEEGLKIEDMPALVAQEVPDLTEEQTKAAHSGIALIHSGIKACQESGLAQERIAKITNRLTHTINCGCGVPASLFVRTRQFQELVCEAWEGINAMTPELLDEVLVEDLWEKILPFCGAKDVARLGTCVSFRMSELISNSLAWALPEEIMRICGPKYRVIRLGETQPAFICDRLNLIKQFLRWEMYGLPPKLESKGEYSSVRGLRAPRSEGLTLCGGCDMSLTLNEVITTLAPKAGIEVRIDPAILEALGTEPVRVSEEWVVLTNSRVGATYGKYRPAQEAILEWYQCSFPTAPLFAALCVLTQINFKEVLRRHPEGVMDENTSSRMNEDPIVVAYNPSSLTLYIRTFPGGEVTSRGSGAQWKV